MELSYLELYRRRLGMNQKELAQKMHYKPCVMSQLENGCRKPWPDLRQVISKTLGLPEEKLFQDGQLRMVKIDDLLISISCRYSEVE